MTNTDKTNPDGLTFGQWLRAANAKCTEISGVGIDDLADGPSWDSWNAGLDPTEYVYDRLEEEGFPF